jgi:UDP-3-O-[3-hydroxymyristoyl] glucosamine N-acyltransferase
MIISNSNKLFAAISYDTATFKDLQYWLKTLHDIVLHRFDPNEVIANLSTSYQYINLVIKDFQLRQQITELLDCNSLDRFSFVHPSASVEIFLDPVGILVYPGTVIYPNACIHKDVIIHGRSLVAHFCEIGIGSYLSAGVVIGGSTKIGSFCSIGLSVTIYDGLSIASNVFVGPSTTIKKNILDSGIYTSSKLVKKIK